MSPDLHPTLVCDASVTINLLGTGIAGNIVGLLGRPVVMADRTFREVRRHPIAGRDLESELKDLVHARHLVVRPLESAAKDLFFDLTSADLVGGLDDGEAATIALAATMGGTVVPVIDDRKARSLLLRRWPQQAALYSADLLADGQLESALSRDALATAVHSALMNARMRIPAARRDWVEKLIGIERAKACPSWGSSS